MNCINLDFKSIDNRAKRNLNTNLGKKCQLTKHQLANTT